MKVILTEPVPPLRCLPMMTSAMAVGSAAVGRVARDHVLAVDEEHQIGVLLDAAGLAQVRQARLPFALLDLAVELRDGDDRDLEILGQRLEAPRDVGDLLLAVVVAADRGAAARELEVVDDDQAQRRLGGRPSAVGGAWGK